VLLLHIFLTPLFSQITPTVCCLFGYFSQDCTNAGGICQTWIDGYYVESIVCVIIGILWLRWKGQQTRSLQDLPESAWRYQ